LGNHEAALRCLWKYVRLDSTANAFDSLGDGFMAAGILDSAVWAKQQGIDLDPKIGFLYRQMSYINILQGRFVEAERNTEQFLERSIGADQQARGYFIKALSKYLSDDHQGAFNYCQKAKSLHDTTDVMIRIHEIYWLVGLINLKLNEISDAKQELAKMKEIITANGITATNYRINLYKFYLHLKVHIAAAEQDLSEIRRIFRIFDGPIRDKVKDQTSLYDLAFLNDSFGKLLMDTGLGTLNMAEERFKKALDYNPNFAFTYHNLSRLYVTQGEQEKAAEALSRFKVLWDRADPEVKRLYGLAE
jgi:tetratricopeptide (TPR) repeat protein